MTAHCVAPAYGSSDRASYAESLKLIRELDFDVLVPWAARGEPWYSETTPELTRERIDILLERLG
mgnify:CR=1 FL=1